MDIDKALEKINTAERLLQEAKQLLTAAQQNPVPISKELSKEQTEDPIQPEPAPKSAHDINTTTGIVAQLLELAMNQSKDAVAEVVLDEITHITIGPKALVSMMRFNWTRLKAQVHDYLRTPSDPYSFTIVREQDRNTGNIAEKKLFLEAKSRNPVPLTLRKDIGEEHWRIYTFSL